MQTTQTTQTMQTQNPQKVKMTIHRALSELKLIDKKLPSSQNSELIAVTKKNGKIDGLTIEEFSKKAQSNHDSTMAHMKNAKTIKSAIAMSNATTTVKTTSGKIYTIVEALQRKEMMTHEQSYLNALKAKYNQILTVYNGLQQRFDEALEKHLTNTCGGKENRKPEDVEIYVKAFTEREQPQIIDPINLKNIIEKLENNIFEFINEIDYKLSESNSTTYIEVELDGN